MKNFLIFSVIAAFTFCILPASSVSAKPYESDLDTKLLVKTNKDLERMLPTIERQVELIIKMISNGKYRERIEDEFSKVMVSYRQGGGNYDPSKCGKNCRAISTKENQSAWERGTNLSFLASVLDEYKAPLSKTCIGILQDVDASRNMFIPNIYQPLNWNFPIAYLSGQMFSKQPNKNLGFGVVDLRSLDESELIQMSRITNQIIELQIILRDGIDGKLDEQELQKYKTFQHASARYLGKYRSPFGTADHKPYDKKPCDIFEGKGQAEHMWPVLGYEIILPPEIIENAASFNWRRNDYIFGGGLLKSDLAKFPTEYIDAWKNLANYYINYFPDMDADISPEMYEELLTEKTKEPLGDFMAEGNDDELPSLEEDGLELPSLE